MDHRGDVGLDGEASIVAVPQEIPADFTYVAAALPGEAGGVFGVGIILGQVVLDVDVDDLFTDAAVVIPGVLRILAGIAGVEYQLEIF